MNASDRTERYRWAGAFAPKDFVSRLSEAIADHMNLDKSRC